MLVCLPEAGVWPEALGVVDRWAPEEPVVAELVPCRLPSLLWEGGGGSRDCSGATSWSMASNTDDTCCLTSPSCTGSLSLSALQTSRWDREKVERAWIGPSEPGSAS